MSKVWSFFSAYYLVLVLVFMLFGDIVGVRDIVMRSSFLLVVGALVLFCGLLSSGIICGSTTLCNVDIYRHVSLCALGLIFCSTLSGAGTCFIFSTPCLGELCIENV